MVNTVGIVVTKLGIKDGPQHFLQCTLMYESNHPHMVKQ